MPWGCNNFVKLYNLVMSTQLRTCMYLTTTIIKGHFKFILRWVEFNLIFAKAFMKILIGELWEPWNSKSALPYFNYGPIKIPIEKLRQIWTDILVTRVPVHELRAQVESLGLACDQGQLGPSFVPRCPLVVSARHSKWSDSQGDNLHISL